MRTQINNLLKIKEINAEQKLLIIIIIENEWEDWKMPCNITAGQMGKLLGITRKKTLELIWETIELGLINSTVENRERFSKITPLLKRMINEEKGKGLILEKKDGTTETIPRPNTTSTITKI